MLLAALAVCASCDRSVREDQPSRPTSGGGGGGGAGEGGAGTAGGSAGGGGQGLAPWEPAWSYVLPDVGCADVAADPLGNIYFLGFSEDAFELGGMGVKAGPFLAKLGPDGLALWTRTLDQGVAVLHALALAPAAGVVFVLRKTPSYLWGAPPPNPQWERIFLTAFDTNGQMLWEQSFGGDYEQGVTLETAGLDLVVDPDGRAVVAVAFNGTMETSIGTFSGGPAYFFARFDVDGAILEATTLVGAGTLGGAASDLAGNIVITGSFADSWSLAGQTLTAAGYDDGFVVKLDHAFSPLWAVSFPSAYSSNAERLAVGEDDRVFVVGTAKDGVDLGDGQVAVGWDSPFLVALDASGTYAGSVVHAESSVGDMDFGDRPHVVVAATPSGRAAFATRFSSYIELGNVAISTAPPLGHGLAVATYLPSMVHEAGTVVRAGFMDACAVAVSPTGRVFFAGEYLGPLAWNDDVLVEPKPEDDPWASDPWGTLLAVMPP